MSRQPRPDVVTVIGILELILAAPFMIGALTILLIPVPAVLMSTSDPVGLTAAIFGLALGILVCAAMGVLFVVAGIGMLRVKSWARILTIVLAILITPGFPVGTILGIAALVYLFRDDVRELFAPNRPATQSGGED